MRMRRTVIDRKHAGDDAAAQVYHTSTRPLCDWLKALLPHGRPLYKVRTGAVPYTRSEPARCDRDNVSSGRNVTFGAMSVEHRSTARTSAPDIALFRKDSGDVTGRADEQIGTAAGDVAVPARVRK